MKPSDFKAGDNLWRVDYDKKSGEVSYKSFPISKVGRKYVYVQHGSWETQFQMHVDGDCFIEVKDWGSPEILYFSEQDARDYVERLDYMDFISRLNPYSLSRYSLKTLREAVRILKAEEGGGSNGIQ